jgi:hypothetical protein
MRGDWRVPAGRDDGTGGRAATRTQPRYPAAAFTRSATKRVGWPPEWET